MSTIRLALPDLRRGKAFFALLLCLALVPSRALASPGPDDIVVVGAKGDVQITMGGASQAAKAGSTLELPAAIRTGSDGSLDLRQGETTIGVGPGTHLEFPAPGPAGGPLDQVVQPRGNAFYDVSPREGRRFRVETPFLVAVIKGTQFNVAAEADSSTISLFEGRLAVLATDSDAMVELNAGEVATRRRGESAIRVLRLDDDKAAFAVPDGGGTEGKASGLIPIDAAEPAPDLLPDGSPLDDEVDDVIGADAAGGGIESVDSGIGIDIDDVAGAVAGAGVDAGISLDADGIDAAVDAGVDLGAGTLDADVDAGVDLGAGSIDAGIDAAADLGAGTVDTGVDAGADLGTGSVDAGIDAGADLGAGSVDAGAEADVDLGAGTVEADVDAGADLDAGTVDAGVDTNVLGADTSVDLGVDLSGDDAGLDVGVDLGTGESPATGETPESGDSGGLLDGLLRGRGIL